MGASRGACLNHPQVATHRGLGAYFDNSERPAGRDLRIYCDVGFGFRLSATIRGVLDPWSAVATWVAGKAFLRLANRLGEIHRSMNAALAKSESGA